MLRKTILIGYIIYVMIFILCSLTGKVQSDTINISAFFVPVGLLATGHVFEKSKYKLMLAIESCGILLFLYVFIFIDAMCKVKLQMQDNKLFSIVALVLTIITAADIMFDKEN